VVGGISIIEGPMPDHDSLMAGIAERILKVPRFRQVLRTHVLDLGSPEWVEDPNLDLSHHIHRAALPHPGDDEELFRFAADVMERRLDRERPLWECWLIEGLTGGRWAMLMKIHHCIADGIATMHILWAERNRLDTKDRGDLLFGLGVDFGVDDVRVRLCRAIEDGGEGAARTAP
jgi:diacylglycerol O-acyltransferase